MPPLFSRILDSNACHLNGSEHSSLNDFALKWQEDYGGEPMCIFKKAERDSLQCAEDSDFRMLTCKGTFDFIHRVNFDKLLTPSPKCRHLNRAKKSPTT